MTGQHDYFCVRLFAHSLADRGLGVLSNLALVIRWQIVAGEARNGLSRPRLSGGAPFRAR
jgi:hypothetical protein